MRDFKPYSSIVNIIIARVILHWGKYFKTIIIIRQSKPNSTIAIITIVMSMQHKTLFQILIKVICTNILSGSNVSPILPPTGSGRSLAIMKEPGISYLVSLKAYLVNLVTVASVKLVKIIKVYIFQICQHQSPGSTGNQTWSELENTTTTTTATATTERAKLKTVITIRCIET